MGATVVLVHGAWHGSWCWQLVTPLLDARGIRWIAPDLPTCDERRAAPATLLDDTATVRTVLDGLDVPAIVCAHSYAGFVATQAACDHAAVVGIVYVAAFMPGEGETLLSLISSEADAPILGALHTRPDGRTAVAPERLTEIFFNDCDPADAAWAVASVSAMFMTVNEPAFAFVWKSIPSVYVVTTRDNAIPPPLQRRMSKHASRVLEWDTSHSPFISQPQLVADLLVSLVEALP